MQNYDGVGKFTMGLFSGGLNMLSSPLAPFNCQTEYCSDDRITLHQMVSQVELDIWCEIAEMKWRAIVGQFSGKAFGRTELDLFVSINYPRASE